MRFIFIAGIIFLVFGWLLLFLFVHAEHLAPQSFFCPCSGQVLSVQERGISQELTLTVDHKKIALSFSLFPVFSVGDTMVFNGRFEPYTFDDPYHRTALARGVRGAIVSPVLLHHILLDRFDLRWFFPRLIVATQHAVLRKIQRVLSPPASSLAIGIVIGEHEFFSRTLKDAFRATGLSHVVAVSGTNVTLLLLFLQPIFLVVPRRFRFWCSFLSVGFFVFVAGADPPVIRAACTGLIGFFGIMHNHRMHAGRLFFLVFLMMAFWNPLQVIYDVSFQLSFVATAGLLFLSPSVERFLRPFFSWEYLRKSLSITLAAYCATLPFSFFVFHQVSLIAPLANILVEPLIPLAMSLVLLFLLTSVVFPLVSFFFSAGLALLLFVFIKGILFLSGLPFVVFTW